MNIKHPAPREKTAATPWSDGEKLRKIPKNACVSVFYT